MSLCAGCVESVPDDYVINTGDGYWCGWDGVTHDLGNLKLVTLQYTPNVIEHRSGKTGSIDKVIVISEDFLLTVTVDRFNPRNVALIFGQDVVSVAGGCRIPLARRDCGREGSFQFVHTFNCSDGKTMTIDIWRAQIAAQTAFSFGEQMADFPLAVRALPCDSVHPTEPYGRITFSDSCPVS